MEQLLPSSAYTSSDPSPCVWFFLFLLSFSFPPRIRTARDPANLDEGFCKVAGVVRNMGDAWNLKMGASRERDDDFLANYLSNYNQSR